MDYRHSHQRGNRGAHRRPAQAQGQGTPPRLAAVLALAAALMVPTMGVADSATIWQGFRGQTSPGALPEAFGLSEVWQRPLGPGYSSIAATEDRLVTLFTSGEDDVLAAFNSADGQEIWRLKLAEKYAGHHGSDDGPLASPTIDGDRVYALGPKGQLVAADLNNGKELWRVELNESNSNVPFYGYTSSPLAVDGLVVVMAGGPGRTVVAYDGQTGQPAWSTGDDSVVYQTPIVAELAGERQLVAVSDFEVRGLNPRDGKQLWSFRHNSGSQADETAHPTAIDHRRLAINLDSGLLMLQVAKNNGTWQAQELWRSRALGNSLVLPVLHRDTLFGFTGNILSATNPESGDFRWRSRGARALNLSLVDDHLAMLTRDGHLVLAATTDDAYAETARFKVFERGDYADPAFYNGTFYVRNQSHMAAVKIDANAKFEPAPPPPADPNRHLGDFGAFIKSLEAKPEAQRQAAVDAYFNDPSRQATPLVEDDGSAHIIYRGDAQEVLTQGSFLDGGEEVSMHRVAGTDLFYRSLALDPLSNYHYAITIGFEAASTDPANPLTIDAGWRVRSELRMPGFRANPYLEEPGEDTARGHLDSFQFHSKVLNNRRQIQVWTPPGFSADTDYPLLVVNYGLRAVRNGRMVQTLDHLVGRSVQPLVVAFVPRADPTEYNGEAAPDYGDFLADELVPHLRQHYGVGEERAILGAASGAVVALRTAMSRAGTFQQVALQTFYLGDEGRDAYLQMIDSSPESPRRVRFETGPNDYDFPDTGVHAQRSTETMAERLKAKGSEVEIHTVHGTSDWVGWRAQFDLILEDLFPLQPQ